MLEGVPCLALGPEGICCFQRGHMIQRFPGVGLGVGPTRRSSTSRAAVEQAHPEPGYLCGGVGTGSSVPAPTGLSIFLDAFT